MDFIGSSVIVIIILAGIGVATYFAVQAAVGPPTDSSGIYQSSQAPPSTVGSGGTGNVTALPDTPAYNPIDDGDYLKYINYDSPSFDIIPAKSDENKNMTIAKCKQRCNTQPNCVGFDWDPNQNNYCSSKVKVNFPLRAWSGNLYVKKGQPTK
jgi:hypothetical protein